MLNKRKDVPLVGDDVPQLCIASAELCEVFSREMRPLSLSFIILRIAPQLLYLGIPFLYAHTLYHSKKV